MVKLLLPFLLLVQPLLAAETVQLAAAAVQFRSSFDVADNMTRMVRILEDLAGRKVQVAVFPECALTGYHTRDRMEAGSDEVERAEAAIARTCRSKGIAAVFGSIYRAGPRTYDTAVVFNSKGELVERFGKLMLAGEKWAVPGNHIAFFELEGVPSTVIVCHDERFPEFVRLPAMAGARIVYYVSHEAGMAKESKLAGYRAQMMARAVENRVFVVASNAPGNIKDNSGSHGQSRIIKDDGNVLQEASFYGDDILVETLSIDLSPSGWIEEVLKGLGSEWWKAGLDAMMKNRNRKLD